MKKYLYNIVLLIVGFGYAQTDSIISKEVSITSFVDGTLLLPKDKATSLAIIIAGSGPIDRNGNQNFLKSNNLKKLAEGLTNNGIATFRYDKRIVKQIRQNKVDPNILFDDFVTDAKAVLDYFKSSGEFKTIYIIGHSQGSLVGMLAAKDGADGFVSLAGAGQNIGDVIVEQVSKTAPELRTDAQKTVDVLKSGQTTSDYPKVLASMFSNDIQSFMINWMAHEPSLIIKDLDMPILIINGTKDLQVSVDEAKLLKSANQKAQLNLIDNMNHVLFLIEGGPSENFKSYNEGFRAVSEELIQSITTFIKQ